MRNLMLFVCIGAFLTGCPEKVEAPKADSPKAEQTVDGKTEVKPAVSKKPVVAKVKAKGATDGTGYFITYPKEWDLKPKYMGTDTMALSKPESKTDGFMENVNVVSEDVRSPITPKAYKDLSMPMMKKMLTGFRVESEKKVKLASGLDGYEMVYRHEMGQLKMKVKATFLMKGSTGYVVTCSADPNSYKKFEKDFDQITGSFQFK